jgi:hypothetical protein
MAKYPYKQLGVKLDRDYRNALNDNFKDIETDLVTEKQRVDNALSEQKDRVDTLITEVEQPSEVVDSRGGFTVLRDRLDDSDTQLAENTDKLLKKDAIGIAYLTEYGNITTGANVTVAANAATDDLLAKYGGGTILYPVGSFVAEGIKVKNGIKHIGANMIGTRLKLPNTSSNHIFVGETDEVLDGGGIYDFELVGNALGTDHNGIDLSACSRANSYYIQDNYIHHFNIGVKSTKNDRQLIAQGNRIWSNDIGWYVILNHPTFGINDIRDNRIGLGGETLYDIQMFGTRFVYNDYGIKANNFSGSHLSSVFFFKNSVQSLEINDDMNVNGCLFVPNDTNDVGIYIKGYYNNVTGNTFRKEDTKKFGNTAILLYEPDHSSVTDNNFECNGRILT